MNLTTLYQEQYPERARTYASTAEAFNTTDYACAIEIYRARSFWCWLCRWLCSK